VGALHGLGDLRLDGKKILKKIKKKQQHFIKPSSAMSQAA